MSTVRVKVLSGMSDELTDITSIMIVPEGHLRIQGKLSEGTKYNTLYAGGQWISVTEYYPEEQKQGE